MYVQGSIANPLGVRPYDAWLTSRSGMSGLRGAATPRAGTYVTDLGKYIRSRFPLPTTDLSGLGIDMNWGASRVFPNFASFERTRDWSVVRPGWGTKDAYDAPVPRVYMPPEVARVLGPSAPPQTDFVRQGPVPVSVNTPFDSATVYPPAAKPLWAAGVGNGAQSDAILFRRWWGPTNPGTVLSRPPIRYASSDPSTPSPAANPPSGISPSGAAINPISTTSGPPAAAPSPLDVVTPLTDFLSTPSPLGGVKWGWVAGGGLAAMLLLLRGGKR